MSTWVLLRGWMRDARHWGEFPRLLRQAAGSQEKVVTLDFPGNGALYAEESAASVEEMADYCHAQLAQMGLAPPYGVLALSLGAMVAVAWNDRHPADIGRMALINTSLAPYSPFWRRLRPANYPALFGALLRASVIKREMLVMRLTSNLKESSSEKQAILAQWIAFAAQCPLSRANALRQLRAAARYRAPRKPPAIPVLLLGSERDRLVSVQSTVALARAWQCPVSLHPGAGHDLPLDDGEWVARQVGEWLKAAGAV